MGLLLEIKKSIQKCHFITFNFFIFIEFLLLVKACELIGEENYSFWGFSDLKGLNIPISVIAVIIAASATSVPDTILSIKDAKKVTTTTLFLML